MKPVLDSTAGNRAMWKNKNPPFVVFFDKEIELFCPPHVLGVWQNLPFRDNVFSVVIFDPPHAKFGLNSVHMNPKGWNDPEVRDSRKIGGTFWGSLEVGWFGVFNKAQIEFARVSDRLVFKWNETSHSLEKVLFVFSEWRIQFRNQINHNKKRGKSKTWWVMLLNKGA